MGARVTWRSRPRWDGKFQADETGSLDGYSGPFTERQIIELMWRVKSIRIAATMTYPGGTESFNHLMTRRHPVTMAEITNESQLMVSMQTGSISFAFALDSDGYGEGRFILNALTSVRREGGDEYWLKGDGMIYGKNSDGADSVFAVIDGDNYELDVSTTLELSDGDSASFTLCMSAASEATGTCALSVAEWWPYADKAGLPAWNTTTGKKANGGPGG